MTKINEHADVPQSIKQPIYRHSSDVVRSPGDAGGEVARSSYADKPPAPTREE